MNMPRNSHREPFIRMVKRSSITARKAWLIRAVALLGALVTGGLLMIILGHNPFEVYSDMVSGALGRNIFIEETVRITIPLLIVGIAVSLAFKMQFWNIGAEGQILVGGTAATAVALFMSKNTPSFVMLLIMAVAAIIAGGIYGAIPAVCKAKWDTNETLFTLMLNYIAIEFIQYLQYRPSWQIEGTEFPKIRNVPEAARLPQLFGVHIGWVFAIIIVVAAYIYMTRTKQGYEIAVVGESRNTARYAGMNVGRIFIRTMFISGALAGFAGFLQVAGADGTLTIDTAGGAGFTAITVAWLAKMNPLAMVIVAFFIAVLQRGSNRIQTTLNIPKSASDVLIGIILFFMLGCEFFINYRLIFRGGKEHPDGQHN